MPSLTNDITNVLTCLTVDNLTEMDPADRQLLRDECERVCKIIEGDRVVEGARRVSPPRSKLGVLWQPWETD